MTTLYIIRHCEALGNVDRTFQGLADTDITALGKQQLEALHKRFISVHLDAVYSSPLKRAYKTAQCVADDKGLAIIKKHNLIELNGGVIEGLKYTEIYKIYPELEHNWEFNPQDFAAPGGEPMRCAYERAWKAICEIVSENIGKNVGVTTHGGIIRCLLCRILKNDIERLRDVTWSDNTAVAKIVFDDNMNCFAEFINDTSHLNEELLPAAHKITSSIGGKI